MREIGRYLSSSGKEFITVYPWWRPLRVELDAGDLAWETLLQPELPPRAGERRGEPSYICQLPIPVSMRLLHPLHPLHYPTLSCTFGVIYFFGYRRLCCSAVNVLPANETMPRKNAIWLVLAPPWLEYTL